MFLFSVWPTRLRANSHQINTSHWQRYIHGLQAPNCSFHFVRGAVKGKQTLRCRLLDCTVEFTGAIPSSSGVSMVTGGDEGYSSSRTHTPPLSGQRVVTVASWSVRNLGVLAPTPQLPSVSTFAKTRGTVPWLQIRPSQEIWRISQID